MVQPLGLWAHPARGPVADGQEPGREIVPLQSGQTLVHSIKLGRRNLRRMPYVDEVADDLEVTGVVGDEWDAVIVCGGSDYEVN